MASEANPAVPSTQAESSCLRPGPHSMAPVVSAMPWAIQHAQGSVCGPRMGHEPVQFSLRGSSQAQDVTAACALEWEGDLIRKRF